MNSAEDSGADHKHAQSKQDCYHSMLLDIHTSDAVITFISVVAHGLLSTRMFTNSVSVLNAFLCTHFVLLRESISCQNPRPKRGDS